ncbi:MAG TPA: hypothetical protein ENN76_02745, partial [Euryarchaeota archaeon]|nr:hypothetical protein [Euryarchaeota archaeon]
GEKFAFEPLERARDLRLDYDVTLLPPKKFLLPPNEELLVYSLNKEPENAQFPDVPRRVVIGVHPYDMIAISQMDIVYLGENPDDLYRERRNKTIFIASDILSVGERSFAHSMGTHKVDSGYDLLVSDLGDTVVVDVGSEKGGDLLNKYSQGSSPTEEDLRRVVELRAETQKKYRTKTSVEKERWAQLLESNYKHTVWENKSASCLECGSCTLVCPTCYCFDVNDVNSISMKGGARVRTWDGCLLKDFTLVAGGEVFREKVKDRYRHRFYRKGKYLPDRFGFVACVGCGRCATVCLPDIADPTAVMDNLGRSKDLSPVNLKIPRGEKMNYKKPLMKPRSGTIVCKKDLTSCEVFFEIEMDDGEPLNHRAGQFVEVSVYGVGEAPISISSHNSGKDTFEMVVRKVGDVTNKLATLNAGDKIGIRGPLGNWFDLEGMKGKNLVLIAGGLGIVPMRSLIGEVLEHRNDFQDVYLMYGCKEPKELLFTDEVEIWRNREDIKHFYTVDKCPENACWGDNVGLITTLIPKADFDPKETLAVIIGPPIMYHFVISELKKKGMSDHHIIVDLERKMKCGVGKCGHCQINGVYVCIEGPVFNYGEIKDLPEAFTLGF